MEAELEQYRPGLTGYCYRMVGSAFDADDAVQETLLRAWKHRDRFDDRKSSLKTWLFSIATNVCLDLIRGSKRRALAMDLGPASYAAAPLGEPLPGSTWVQPVPDAQVLDPADLAGQRETIRLAFVAALQHLPPRQRAVLILRDVLSWKAAEVAELLDTSVASINSALQRGRATLAAREPAPADPYDPLDPTQRDLLGRYVEAFERHDVDAMVALLHQDATMSMPPFAWWLAGRDEIAKAVAGGGCEGARLVPTSANGTAAFGQYRPAGDLLVPFGLMLFELRHDRISAIATYLDPALLPYFDLPPTLDR